MTNLVDFLENNKVRVVESFPAFTELQNCDDDNALVLSSATPSKLIEKNINEYYSLILPRGFKAETADDLLELNPQVQLNYIEEVEVKEEEITKENAIIVSRHESTNKILQSKYPDLDILTENVAKSDIENKIVIGVLPPFLIKYSKAFIATSINNYDASKKDDVEITENDLIMSKAIVLDVITENPNFIEQEHQCSYCSFPLFSELKINSDVKTEKQIKKNIFEIVRCFNKFRLLRTYDYHEEHLNDETNYIYDCIYNKKNNCDLKYINNYDELILHYENLLKIKSFCITQTRKINENTLSFTILKY